MTTTLGRSLAKVEVAADGASFDLHITDAAGRPAKLTLPTECLGELLMTLPRVVARALRAKHGDNSLRLVYPLADWRLETSVADPRLILTMSTPDGFEVAFSLLRSDIDSIADTASQAASVERRRITVN